MQSLISIYHSTGGYRLVSHGLIITYRQTSTLFIKRSCITKYKVFWCREVVMFLLYSLKRAICHCERPAASTLQRFTVCSNYYFITNLTREQKHWIPNEQPWPAAYTMKEHLINIPPTLIMSTHWRAIGKLKFNYCVPGKNCPKIPSLQLIIRDQVSAYTDIWNTNFSILLEQ